MKAVLDEAMATGYVTFERDGVKFRILSYATKEQYESWQTTRRNQAVWDAVSSDSAPWETPWEQRGA